MLSGKDTFLHFPQTVTLNHYLRVLQSIFVSGILNKLKKLSTPESNYMNDYYIQDINLDHFEIDQVLTTYQNLITSVARINKDDIASLRTG